MRIKLPEASEGVHTVLQLLELGKKSHLELNSSMILQ